MDVIWTRQALRSLESMADYIARDNLQAAHEVTEAIRRTALLLDPELLGHGLHMV